NGNSKKSLGRDSKGGIIILPPVSFEEHVAVQRETKARTLLLQSLLEDHMADFYHLDDAREIWLAVKARFDGNEESKKMRKTMLKQAFLEFSVSEEEGLHKGYDRALPSSWSQVALTLKTRGGLEYLSFDDLYNKLRECNVKKVDEKAKYSTFKISETEEAEQVYGLMVGFESEFAVPTGNAVGGVNPVAIEFAMMGNSPKAKLEKNEWEVKFVESLARFDKWKESSKNLAKLLYSSMSTRTKLGLGFKEYIGSDEVCDLSIPSVFNPEPDNREVKSLYESDKSSASETYDFASCVSSPKTNDSFSTIDVKLLPKFDVKDPSLTNNLPSCPFKENVKPHRNLCNKSETPDRIPCKNTFVRTKKCFVCGSKSHLIKDFNVHDTVDNFPSVVSKAASIPAGSRNSSASISAGRSIPTTSRNRSASIHAGRSIPAASRNKPASIHAGKHIHAGRINKPAPFPAGTHDTNIIAGTQADDSESEYDEQVILFPSFPSKSFSVDTVALLPQAKIEIRRNLVPAVGDPAGSIVSTGGIPAGSAPASYVLAGEVLAGSIVSTGGIPAGSVPASGVHAGSLHTSSFPASSVPAGSLSAISVPAGGVHARSIDSAEFGVPAASESVPVVLSNDPAASSPLPPGHSLGSCEHTIRFHSSSDLGNHQPTAGIFFSSSYDDDFYADFTNLALNVVVDPVATKRQVWKLVPLPDGKIAIGTKWILKNKRDARGIVVRNKSRLVAQGHRQKEGIDYDEGFEDPHNPKHVYRVVKALYGLHQAPRAWFMWMTYFGSTNKAWCDEFEVLMKGEFEMSAMGELTFFLGLQVKQLPGGIFISQDKYVKYMLKKFDMERNPLLVDANFWVEGTLDPKPDVRLWVQLHAHQDLYG
nr:hypothetical protein [Tanacetum cinerariifolium]